ncbi:MAG: hypothetical protein HFE39_02690 [Clostridiales bacterium]|jgi:aspartokinase|nr:hypothetical protein [Clostridiales bacterium]
MTLKPEITVRDNITLITMVDIPSDIGLFSNIFDKIANYGISIDMISVTPPQGDLISVSFTIDDDDLGRLLEFTADLHNKHNDVKPIVSSGNSKITIEDPAMETEPGVAAKVFKAAASANADIRIITTSETQISMLVTEAAFDGTYQAILNALAQ